MKNSREIVKALALVSQLGLSMAIPIIGCVLFGHWLDNRFNTGAIFLIIFVILGVGASFRNLYVMVMQKWMK